MTFGAGDAPVKNLTPLRDIVIPVVCKAYLGWAMPGDEFQCMGRTKSGYSILVPVDDDMHIGLIPFRDEWGHVSAETSDHRLKIPDGIIRIKIPTKIRPGPIVLTAGTVYSAVALGRKYNVVYKYGKYKAVVTVDMDCMTPVAKTDEEARSVSADMPEKVAVPGGDALPDGPISEKAEQALRDLVKEIPEVAAIEDDDPTHVVHSAIGAGISVSSTHQGAGEEGEPSMLVDGDLKTRWSSEYSEPQVVTVDLKKNLKLTNLRLHWEAASALQYTLSISNDGKSWKNIRRMNVMVSEGFPERVDALEMKGAKARYIKLGLLKRINPAWGFSLFEIEVHGEKVR
ncbi:MAG: discoidin domain-containing protein [Lentisphaerae bacterium]|nr:discoidin domain-containing protein [Lentisphaerota bacterium]